MKDLYQKYTKETLTDKYLKNPFNVYKDQSLDTISKCKEDNELLKSVFAKGDVLMLTADQIVFNFVSEDIWLFTLDGKIINLEDYTYYEDGNMSFAGESIHPVTGEFVFCEIFLKETDIINVFYSDYQPIENNNKANLESNNKDLEWLLK